MRELGAVGTKEATLISGKPALILKDRFHGSLLMLLDVARCARPKVCSLCFERI